MVYIRSVVVKNFHRSSIEEMLSGLHRVKLHKVKLRLLRRSVTTVTDVSAVSGRIDAVNLSVEEVVTKNMSKLEKVR